VPRRMAKGAAHVCFGVPGNGFGMAFVFVTAGRHPAAMPGGPGTERWYNVNAQRGYAAGLPRQEPISWPPELAGRSPCRTKPGFTNIDVRRPNLPAFRAKILRSRRRIDNRSKPNTHGRSLGGRRGQLACDGGNARQPDDLGDREASRPVWSRKPAPCFSTTTGCSCSDGCQPREQLVTCEATARRVEAGSVASVCHFRSKAVEQVPELNGQA
jgi:hypothetical protein